MPIDDATLVQRTLRGDLAAFGCLVERYQGAVYALCVDRLADAHAARDCAQEAFLRALDKLATLRAPGAFGAWLRRIAERHAVSWRRREARRPDRGALPPEVVAPAPEATGDHEAIRAAVRALPAPWRLALRLRYQEGCSYAEIASFLGVTENVVGVRLHRARRALRAALEQVTA